MDMVITDMATDITAMDMVIMDIMDIIWVRDPPMLNQLPKLPLNLLPPLMPMPHLGTDMEVITDMDTVMVTDTDPTVMVTDTDPMVMVMDTDPTVMVTDTDPTVMVTIMANDPPNLLL